MSTREEVVRAARSYLKTPFQHQGRLRGMAMDCVGLVLSVAQDLSLSDVNGVPLTRGDYSNYSAQPSDDFVQRECKRRLIEKPWSQMKAGDVVTVKLPYFPCHTGILSDMGGVLYVVHAYNGGKYQVIEHIVDDQFRHRITGVFTLPGVEL